MQMQGHCQVLYFKDQDKENDLSGEDQDQDFTLVSKDWSP